MSNYADLHLHTTYSDGTLSLPEVLAWVQKRDVKMFSIADHDTTEPLAEAKKWAEADRIDFLPAVELTTDIGGKEVHILGYFRSWGSEPFQKMLEKIRRGRIERMKKLLAKLEALGVHVSMQEVQAQAATGNLSRVHLANVLVTKGYASTAQDAFRLYLGDKAPAYVPCQGLSSREGIDWIHSIGGLAFIAHPAVSLSDSHLTRMEEEGVDGIEAYHPTHSRSQTEYFLEWAIKRQKLITGGSDCHGNHKDGILIGRVPFPLERAMEIRERLAWAQNPPPLMGGDRGG